MTMLSTPEHIKAYALLALIAAFEIEIHTGRKVTRLPLVKHTRKRYGTKSRTKAGTLEELYIIREEMTARKYEDHTLHSLGTINLDDQP